MKAGTQAISILRIALMFLSVVTFTDTYVLTLAAQDTAKKETPYFQKVERTVQKLLATPVYTAADEKLLNSAGDSAAVAIKNLVSEPEMNSPDMARRILMILHLAFEVPQAIIETSDKTATVALPLLDQLAKTDYGQQPNVISNARIEIKYSSSTGKPLEPVTIPEDSAVDWEHTQWIQTVLLWTETIKPGMTRSELLKVFATEGGISFRTQQTYVLRQCPLIKVDVQFVESGKEADDKITAISRPYMAYERAD